MKIGGVSSANALLSKNNSSNKHVSPLQRQKTQIQNQINQVEKSNLSKEAKDKKTKELEKNLQEIEQKELEEQSKKLTEGPKVEKADKKSKSEDDEKLKSEDDKNDQPLNKDVVYGISSASTHMKIGRVAYSVYKDAKVKGKTDVAQRALSYASTEFNQSKKSIKLVAKGINEYKKQTSIAKKDTAGDKNPNDNTVKISADNTKLQSDDTVKTSTDNTVKEKAIISKLA